VLVAKLSVRLSVKLAVPVVSKSLVTEKVEVTKEEVVVVGANEKEVVADPDGQIEGMVPSHPFTTTKSTSCR